MLIKYQGEEAKVVFSQCSYKGDVTTKISLVEPDTGLPIATATAPVEDLDDNEVAIKDYSENRGMLHAMLGAGIVAGPHRYVQVGFVTAPVCRLLIKV